MDDRTTIAAQLMAAALAASPQGLDYMGEKALGDMARGSVLGADILLEQLGQVQDCTRDPWAQVYAASRPRKDFDYVAASTDGQGHVEYYESKAIPKYETDTWAGYGGGFFLGSVDNRQDLDVADSLRKIIRDCYGNVLAYRRIVKQEGRTDG